MDNVYNICSIFIDFRKDSTIINIHAIFMVMDVGKVIRQVVRCILDDLADSTVTMVNPVAG